MTDDPLIFATAAATESASVFINGLLWKYNKGRPLNKSKLIAKVAHSSYSDRMPFSLLCPHLTDDDRFLVLSTCRRRDILEAFVDVTHTFSPGWVNVILGFLATDRCELSDSTKAKIVCLCASTGDDLLNRELLLMVFRSLSDTSQIYVSTRIGSPIISLCDRLDAVLRSQSPTAVAAFAQNAEDLSPEFRSKLRLLYKNHANREMSDLIRERIRSGSTSK